MGNVLGWVRNGLALVGLMALGYWMGSGRVVKAASETMAFQLADVGEKSALLVYRPSENALYVYQGATTGNSHLQCSYKYVLGSRGGSIERQQCGVGSFQ